MCTLAVAADPLAPWLSVTLSVAVKSPGTTVLEARCRHLEHARRNLVRLAQAYRERLRDWQQLSDSGGISFDVHRKASSLRRRRSRSFVSFGCYSDQNCRTFRFG